MRLGSNSAAFLAPTLFQQQMSHMLHTVAGQPSLTLLLSFLVAGHPLFVCYVSFIKCIDLTPKNTRMFLNNVIEVKAIVVFFYMLLLFSGYLVT